MSARFFVDHPLQAAQAFDLPAEAARHVQVLRLQPGDEITVFNGTGGQWLARVTHMGRRDVAIEPVAFDAAERELACPVTLAVGMPANERFDWLVEKATELGVHAIQPLMCERSVLRLDGERAERKRAHWLGVARAAAEQSGRTRVPDIALPLKFSAFLNTPAAAANGTAAPGAQRWVLSLREDSQALAQRMDPAATQRLLLSGPEGGLAPGEEDAAVEAGFAPVRLGARILRAETAPLAALAALDALDARR
jgi:16S rRNA (uracil1498-N3)-methyltransferase